MSTSLSEHIEAWQVKIAAMQEAAKLYPDARIDGDYVISDQLKPEECDHLHCQHTASGDILRVGRQLPGIVVMRPFGGTIPMVLLWDLKRADPDLYQRVVQLVAKRGG